MSRPVRILLVTHDAKDLEHYVEALRREGVSVDAYQSASELRSACAGRSYSGFVIDFKTASRSSGSERAFYASLMESFPVMRLRRSGKDDLVSGVIGWQGGSGASLVDNFLSLCRKSSPRGVRVGFRHEVMLNALLFFSTDAPEEEAVRATVTDISNQGMFLATPQSRPSQKLYVRIKELADSTFLCCEVRWELPWGTRAQHLPGYGLLIESMTESQAQGWKGLLEEAAG